MAKEPYIRIKLSHEELTEMQRMGWHVFKCRKCKEIFVTMAHSVICKKCPPEKKGFLDFIKLLLGRK